MSIKLYFTLLIVLILAFVLFCCSRSRFTRVFQSNRNESDGKQQKQNKAASCRLKQSPQTRINLRNKLKQNCFFEHNVKESDIEVRVVRKSIFSDFLSVQLSTAKRVFFGKF